MAPASSSYKPPQLLHWRGLKRWCVGSRVPSLCEMMMKARSSSTKLSLEMVGKLVLSSSHVRLRASTSSSSAPRKMQARTATCTGDGAPPTAEHEASKNKKNAAHELDRSASSAAQRRGGGGGKQVLFDMAASCSRAREDVVECAESSSSSNRKVRLMARSSSCPNPSRSCREGRSGEQGWMQTLQRRSDAIAGAAAGILGHSRSSSSYRRFSVDGGGGTSRSSSSSRGVLVEKLGGGGGGGGGGYGRQASGGGGVVGSRGGDHQHQQALVPMLLREIERKGTPLLVADLVMGNQFLARVYPAPPPPLSASSSSSSSSLSPSPGFLLLNPPPPPPHLAERLIFFA